MATDEGNQLWEAKLVRGQVFMLKDLKFERGRRKVVDQDTYEYLDENAYEQRFSPDHELHPDERMEHIARFSFKEYTGDLKHGADLDVVETEPAKIRARDRAVDVEAKSMSPTPNARVRPRVNA